MAEISTLPFGFSPQLSPPPVPPPQPQSPDLAALLAVLGRSQSAAPQGVPAASSMAPFGAPDMSDAARWHRQNLAATGEAMANPQTWVDAARQYGNAMLFGTIGGQRSATADLGKLAEARAMTAQGVGRDDILSQTGWYRGADGQWRYEISDQGMTVKPRTTETTTLGAAINHPELFAAYPQLADTQVAMGYGTGGSFRPGEPPMITAGWGKPQEGLFAHEIQHNLQDIEGFEQGGSPKTAFANPEYMRMLNDRARKVTTPLSYEDYANAAWQGEKSAESLADYHKNYLPTVPKSIDWYSDLGKTIQDSVARDIYHRLAGEVEARAVQSRLGMDPQSRLDAGPWWSADVPESQQILRSRQ